MGCAGAAGQRTELAYEAGPRGYGVYRTITDTVHDCQVVGVVKGHPNLRSWVESGAGAVPLGYATSSARFPRARQSRILPHRSPQGVPETTNEDLRGPATGTRRCGTPGRKLHGLQPGSVAATTFCGEMRPVN